jgi:putative ABC transport system substrate-binding protein
MRRRDFFTLLGGAAAAWPVAARAQPSNQMRRIGVLMTTTAEEPASQANLAALAQGLQELGWVLGRNIRIEYRWGAGSLDLFRQYAAELIALKPDAVLATAGSVVGAFQQVSRAIPIVFVTTVDPVGGGWVESLSHPGTNATGLPLSSSAWAGNGSTCSSRSRPR